MLPCNKLLLPVVVPDPARNTQYNLLVLQLTQFLVVAVVQVVFVFLVELEFASGDPAHQTSSARVDVTRVARNI